MKSKILKIEHCCQCYHAIKMSFYIKYSSEYEFRCGHSKPEHLKKWKHDIMFDFVIKNGYEDPIPDDCPLEDYKCI